MTSISVCVEYRTWRLEIWLFLCF